LCLQRLCGCDQGRITLGIRFAALALTERPGFSAMLDRIAGNGVRVIIVLPVAAFFLSRAALSLATNDAFSN
jgi:hypothetical protein